jgi:hypothetical protein
MAKINPGDVEVTTEVVQRVRRRSIADTHESPLKEFMTEISTESGTPTKNKKNLALDLKMYISSVLEASVTQRIMMTATAFSLVGDDLKIATTQKPTDEIFWGIFVFCLIAFVVEFVATLIAREEYFGSFYFKLDIIAMVSLVPDIGWIYLALFPEEDDSGSSGGHSAAARASRMGRIGTKAGRIVRLVRLVRLVRVVRLLKYLKKNANNSQAAGGSKAESSSLNPSQVGSRLTELSTQRLIIIVLVSLLCFPLFEMVPDGSRTGSYDLLAVLHQEHQHPDVSLSIQVAR